MIAKIKSYFKKGFAGGSLALSAGVASAANTYLPDVTTATVAMAAEAKQVGTDMFAGVFPVIAFMVGIGVAIAIFKKLGRKLGG